MAQTGSLLVHTIGPAAGAMLAAVIDRQHWLFCTSFQYVASGLAPFAAGVIGPLLGLRFYFALAIALTLGGLVQWLRTLDRSLS